MLIPVSGRSLQKKAAVFMDRDGTLNLSKKPDGSYLPVNTPEDLVLFEEAKEGLADITQKTDLLKIMVTNQGGVGAGYMTEEQLKAINEKLVDDVRKSGGDIDAIYYSTTLDKADPMRKPNPGMILKAAEEMNIDIANSYMIGDMSTDIACGERANPALTSILVETGKGGTDNKVDIKPDVKVKDFKKAAEFILEDYEKKKKS